MPTARKLPSGKWRTVVYIGTDSAGKKQYKSITDSDKRRCERRALEFAEQYRHVKDNSILAFAINQFIESRKAVLSPSTIRGYRNIERYIKNEHSEIYGAKIMSLDKTTLQKFVNDMVEEGQAPKTVHNKTSFVLSVLKSKDIPVPNLILPEKKKPDLHIPDTKDVKAIIKQAAGSEMQIPILLGAFGPLRRSEIVGLTLDDVQGNIIHVRHAIVMDENGENKQKGTKTYDSDRYIPMDPWIIDKIMEQGYITKITNPQHISQRFEHIAKQAGCPGVRFHDLRHWCASYLHARNIPDEYIMSRAGWRTDRVMKSVYRHELASESNKWNQKINSLFEKVCT